MWLSSVEHVKEKVVSMLFSYQLSLKYIFFVSSAEVRKKVIQWHEWHEWTTPLIVKMCSCLWFRHEWHMSNKIVKQTNKICKKKQNMDSATKATETNSYVTI